MFMAAITTIIAVSTIYVVGWNMAAQACRRRETDESELEENLLTRREFIFGIRDGNERLFWK